MAATIQLRTYLNNVIGLNNNARANAIIDEGIDSLTALTEFSDDDVTTLCNSVRKPGGTIIVNGAEVPNPGQRIPAICETRLRLAVYGAKIYATVGRGIDANSLSAARLQELRQHKATVKGYDEANAIPAISKSFGIMKVLDILPNLFCQSLGVIDIPLSYVIREHAQPGLIPPLSPNVPWSQRFSNMMDELIHGTT